jgi:hypothetical protein
VKFLTLFSKEDKLWLRWQWERFKYTLFVWTHYDEMKYTSPGYFGLSSPEMSQTYQYCGNFSKMCNKCRDMHCQFAGGFTAKELEKNEHVRYLWWRPITFRYFNVGQIRVQRVLLHMDERPEFITPQLWDYLRKMPIRFFTWDRPYNYRGEEWTIKERLKVEAEELGKEIESLKRKLSQTVTEAAENQKAIEALEERVQACLEGEKTNS